MLRKYLINCFLFLLIVINIKAQTNKLRYDSNMPELVLNQLTTEIVEDSNLSNGKGIALKKNVCSAINGERVNPDIVININPKVSGRYVVSSYAVPDEEGLSHFKQSITKFESIYLRIQFDDDLPINRVVAVPWNRPLQTLCKIDLTKNKKQMKIWLPRGIHLEYIELNAYIPPKIPDLVNSFIPKYLPPKSHPRLWLTEERIPSVRSKLTEDENLLIWKALQNRALVPYHLFFDSSKELSNNINLENVCREKAFYYLMTGNKDIAKEAVYLINSYLPKVQFGNLLDITRSIGETIYTASLVYDWCYDFLTDKQKDEWIKVMVNLAEDMEIGWPPFKQSVVNAHGNEAQLSRDLLSMSIAISDEFPEAYSYCSFIVTKYLVPMKNFEYQSPRHPQGVNYGAFRIRWDLHAALLYKNMTGLEIFDSNIKDVFKYWIYMRTPDGQMLRDGDAYGAPKPGENNYYWTNPAMLFLAYVYTGNSYLKSQFIKHGGPKTIEPYLFLLLNQPQIKSVDYHNYPLTIDFGDITGGMIARTGWTSCDDVVVEIKGGGIRNGAHQHSDAGSIQLYYRGFQFGDIGMYLFASTPYDRNFNRRSIAHSMMLIDNLNEYFGKDLLNDGGQRYNSPFPKTPIEATTDLRYKNGEVLSVAWDSISLVPTFNYFSVDLSSAYTEKVSKYVRSLCFINTKRLDVPGLIILSDDLTVSNNNFKKKWQINTHNTPVITKEGLIIENRVDSISPIGRTYVDFLLPISTERHTQILSGKDVFNVGGFYLSPPPQNRAESTAKRTIISPTKNNKRDRYLTVFQITDGFTSQLPIEYLEKKECFVIVVDEKVIVMSNSTNFIENDFQVTIPNDGTYQLAIMGLKNGKWKLTNKNNSISYVHNVEKRNNSFFIDSIPAGDYHILLK